MKACSIFLSIILSVGFSAALSQGTKDKKLVPAEASVLEEANASDDPRAKVLDPKKLASLDLILKDLPEKLIGISVRKNGEFFIETLKCCGSDLYFNFTRQTKYASRYDFPTKKTDKASLGPMWGMRKGGGFEAMSYEIIDVKNLNPGVEITADNLGFGKRELEIFRFVPDKKFPYIYKSENCYFIDEKSKSKIKEEVIDNCSKEPEEPC